MDVEKEKRSNYSSSRSKNIGSRWDKNNKPLSGKKIDNIHMNYICNTHVIHMENENENEIKDVIENKNIFEAFRKAYPGSKRGLDTEFENLKKKHHDYKAILPLLEPALSNQMQWRIEMNAAGMFIPEWPGLAVWINQRRWENEKPVIENKTTKNQPSTASYYEHL
jgi:hypothetical protein